MPQATLGAAVGVDQSTISDWENGKGLGAEFLDALAGALTVSLEWLVRGEQDKEEAQLVGAFYAMNDDGRKNLLSVASALALTHKRPPGKRRSNG